MVDHSLEVYQRLIHWSQLRGICCVGHYLEVCAVSVTAQRLNMCVDHGLELFIYICCVSHSSEAYAVLVTAYKSMMGRSHLNKAFCVSCSPRVVLVTQCHGP